MENNVSKVFYERGVSLRECPFRRFINKPLYFISPKDLCQPFDVDLNTFKKRVILGNDSTKYYMHTTDSIEEELEETLTLGITKICLRPTVTYPASPYAKVEKCSEFIGKIKSKYKESINITIDPFALAMHDDLTWGIKDDALLICPNKSLLLLENAAISFGQAGADQFLTIGRINYEVKAVYDGLRKNNLPTKIISFSTNSETAYAYINETLHDPRIANTGQKLLVGNFDEMILRALFDLLEGADVIIQKPMTNFHITNTISYLLSGELDIKIFLNRPNILNIINTHNYLIDRVEHLINIFPYFKKKKGIGGYCISGNYAIYRLIEEKYNLPLAMALLHEQYLNMKAASSDFFNTIIDRNANWYLKNVDEVLKN